MDWKAHEKYTSKLKRFTKLYARMQMEGKYDYKLLCNVYGDNKEKQPETKVKRMLRSQTVQKMVESEILAEYELQGITPKSVITDERDILSVSFGMNDMSNARQIVHKWGSRVGLDPKEVKTTVSVTATNFNRILEANEPGQLKEVKQIEPKNDE